MTSDLQVKAAPGKFYIGDSPEKAIAEIHFHPVGADRLDVDHTYVSPELRGQRIGDVLLERMVDYARQEGKKIIPTCPFVKKRMNENEEYRDLIAD